MPIVSLPQQEHQACSFRGRGRILLGICLGVGGVIAWTFVFAILESLVASNRLALIWGTIWMAGTLLILLASILFVCSWYEVNFDPQLQRAWKIRGILFVEKLTIDVSADRLEITYRVGDDCSSSSLDVWACAGGAPRIKILGAIDMFFYAIRVTSSSLPNDLEQSLNRLSSDGGGTGFP